MPTAENRTASNGIDTMPPRKRGASTRTLRVDGHHLHRRELLAGLHQADLGRERRAGAAGKQQRSDHRPELAHQRQVDDQAERLGRAVGDERVVHLQRQHEADRQARRQDDDQRPVADRMHLRHDQRRSGAAPPGNGAAPRRRRSPHGRSERRQLEQCRGRAVTIRVHAPSLRSCVERRRRVVKPHRPVGLAANELAHLRIGPTRSARRACPAPRCGLARHAGRRSRRS